MADIKGHQSRAKTVESVIPTYQSSLQSPKPTRVQCSCPARLSLENRAMWGLEEELYVEKPFLLDRK